MPCDAGDLGHPGVRVHRVPFHAPFGVQLVAQHRLVNHAGSLSFVIQRLGIQRHQDPVGAGLAVGHDHVGVQVRVPAARGLVLIRDRHQPRQPLQILHPGARVVHAGVSGVLVQIGHRGRDRAPMRLGDRLVVDLGGQRPQQRHTFGRGESQIKTMHTALPKCPAGRAVGGDPVIEPALRHVGVGRSPVDRAPV